MKKKIIERKKGRKWTGQDEEKRTKVVTMEEGGDKRGKEGRGEVERQGGKEERCREEGKVGSPVTPTTHTC